MIAAFMLFLIGATLTPVQHTNRTPFELNANNLEPWRNHIALSRGELAWQKLDWRTFSDAIKKANQQKKPLLIAAYKENLLGTAGAATHSARINIWSDAKLQDAVRTCVLTAMRHSELWDHLTSAGVPMTRERLEPGVFLVVPSGVLAHCDGFDQEQLLKMIEQAKEPIAGAFQTPTLGESVPPEGGLVLRVVSRDLADTPASKKSQGWNLDYLWTSASENSAILPKQIRVGSRQQWPVDLIARLVRFNLADNVCSVPVPFADSDIQDARLRSTIESLKNGVAGVRFSGSAQASTVRDGDAVGVDAQMLGYGRYDVSRRVWLDFTMLAAGKRWGKRHNGSAFPGQIGFLFTLAGEKPTDLIRPYFLDQYGR